MKEQEARQRLTENIEQRQSAIKLFLRQERLRRNTSSALTGPCFGIFVIFAAAFACVWTFGLLPDPYVGSTAPYNVIVLSQGTRLRGGSRDRMEERAARGSKEVVGAKESCYLFGRYWGAAPGVGEH